MKELRRMAQQQNGQGFLGSRANVVLLGFLAVGGFYLIAEHWAHLLGAAPLLLLLGLCVVMHLFMHSGHGGHGGHGDHDRTADGDRPSAKPPKPPTHQH
ncbi:DUF2933 domain-containing protein [Elioraea tepidiphila]|jgi:hypothetical protein|uniref:DUF2933 domain-containing protein n=1 Tax=Elioraea tepidiphila TaxID=457934 RepID=UPI002FDAAED3